MFIILVCSFWAASPAHAAPAKSTCQARVTIVQTPAIADQGHSERCDQLEDTDVVTAVYNQHTVDAPAGFSPGYGPDKFIYPVIDTPLPAGRGNARIQPFYQLILFPFHVFW